MKRTRRISHLAWSITLPVRGVFVVLLGVATLCVDDIAHAQDVTFVTNIGQPYTWVDVERRTGGFGSTTITTTRPISIWVDGGLAQEFTTGSNKYGYDMSSVVIYGNYGGGDSFIIPSSVSLWSRSNGVPSSLLYTLTYTPSADDSSLGIKLVFQAPVAAILEPNTRYFIVVEPTDESRVVITSSASEDTGALAGWSIGNNLRKKNGDIWEFMHPSDVGTRIFPADRTPVLRTSLHGTQLNSRSIIVSLTKIGEGQFKATVTTSAPFDIVLPLNIKSGSGASSVTIPANSTESDVLKVSRTPGTTLPVSIDIGNLPSPPAGYYLFKSPSRLPLQVIDGVSGGVTPVCNRTAQVRNAILRATPVSTCGEVTEAHLAAITTLRANHTGGASKPTELEIGDLSGLTALTRLELGYYPLGVVLPDGIFDDLVSLKELELYNAGPFTSVPDAILGLTALTYLNLGFNQLASLPTGAFDHMTQLTSLDLSGNDLSSLPAGIFDHLPTLTSLNLEYNDLTSLPAGVFDRLPALTRLNLDGLELTSLPDRVFYWLASLKSLSMRDSRLRSLSSVDFSGLSGLTYLNLYGNRLTSLPSGIFSGLSSLTSLNLSRSTLPPLLDPLALTVSLEQVGEGQFKAVAPTGAPFPIVLLLNITNGNINGGASTLTIPTGRVDSDTLRVTHTTGTTDPVTVDIRTLPGLPTDENQYGTRLHQGYTLVKSTDLPLEVISSGGTSGQAATDFNGDGKTDFVDFFLFADAYGGTDPRFDLDGSGTVDFVDFFKFVDAFGS